MDSFQKRERDRKKREKRRQKQVRKRERQEAKNAPPEPPHGFTEAGGEASPGEPAAQAGADAEDGTLPA